MDEPMSDLVPLASLRWQPFFQQQLTLDEWDSALPARVLEYHRSEMRVLSEEGESVIPLQHAMPRMVVGGQCAGTVLQAHLVGIWEIDGAGQLACFQLFEFFL